MRLFIDSANLDEIREAASWGIISGVTTNPTLVAKEGADFHQRVRDICQVVQAPVSAEVTATEAPAMVEQGKRLADLDENVVVKVPVTPEGLAACAALTALGIDVNVTLIFTANQALMSSLAGARYVSPFVGRLDDVGQDGILLVQTIRDVFDYSFSAEQRRAEIIAASIRHPVHVERAALAGSDIATCPFGVLKQLFRHPLTDQGLEKFLADWNKANQKA